MTHNYRIKNDLFVSKNCRSRAVTYFHFSGLDKIFMGVLVASLVVCFWESNETIFRECHNQRTQAFSSTRGRTKTTTTTKQQHVKPQRCSRTSRRPAKYQVPLPQVRWPECCITDVTRHSIGQKHVTCTPLFFGSGSAGTIIWSGPVHIRR